MLATSASAGPSRAMLSSSPSSSSLSTSEDGAEAGVRVPPQHRRIGSNLIVPSSSSTASTSGGDDSVRLAANKSRKDIDGGASREGGTDKHRSHQVHYRSHDMEKDEDALDADDEAGSSMSQEEEVESESCSAASPLRSAALSAAVPPGIAGDFIKCDEGREGRRDSHSTPSPTAADVKCSPLALSAQTLNNAMSTSSTATDGATGGIDSEVTLPTPVYLGSSGSSVACLSVTKSSPSVTSNPLISGASQGVSTSCASSNRNEGRLEQFGCCVFFFPTPVVSWMLPLAGHVALSNAEGTKLYTFESAYYVREELLANVLDSVLPHDTTSPDSDYGYEEEEGGGRAGSASGTDMTSRSGCGSPTMMNRNCSNFTVNEVTAALASSTSCISTLQRRTTTTKRNKTRRTTSGTGAMRSTPGHAHTKCVRVWDLKPLLMEGRGGRRSLPLAAAVVSSSSKNAASVLWSRLQEFTLAGFDSADREDSGISSSNGNSSGEEEERSYALLDSETARFFNRNLQATIKVFRGSPDGSGNSSDAFLRHHNSFSFVGFVLEVCGIGSRFLASATMAPATASLPSHRAEAQSSGEEATQSPATAPPLPSHSRPTITLSIDGSADVGGANSSSADIVEVEDIHWGVLKLLFNIMLFGEWHRDAKRRWSFMHGGTFAGAVFMWAVLLAMMYRYVLPLVF